MPKKVLIVDDTSLMRVAIGKVVRELDATAVDAVDGEEAVRLYDETRPDLVIMDVTMPKKDGVTAIREILAINPAAVIHVLSALKHKEIVDKCLAAGAKSHLPKPLDKTLLKKMLASELGEKI